MGVKIALISTLFGWFVRDFSKNGIIYYIL